MSITQKLEKNYKNQIELIKNEKIWKTRIRLIGALCLDIGGRCIKAVAEAIGSCRRYVKKCYLIMKNNLIIISNKNNCGRKKKTEEYSELINDIKNIIENNTYTDPRFGTEIQFCSLTIDEVMTKLMSLNKYPNKFISRSALATLLNELGFNFKKVKRNKPLKKIAETDLIFENVKNKKEEAFKEETTALISIDTKDKVLIGPYSRRGKSRVTIEACDHELTNRCLIPFGILDLKTNQSYFYNFNNKPTSLAIVDCIEDYIKQNTKYNKINILLDNGPDNSGVRTAFIKGLADIANKYQKK